MSTGLSGERAVVSSVRFERSSGWRPALWHLPSSRWLGQDVGVQLRPRPTAGLVDDLVVWQVDGAAPGTQVWLDVEATDGAGRHWRSRDRYPVGADGTLQLDDPDRPWWSMSLVDTSPPTTFSTGVDGWTASVRASTGDTSAEAQVERRYSRDLDTDTRAGDGWRMDLYLPRRASSRASGVLLVGGSTGMAAVKPRAALLASHGYATAVLGYMQEPGLPPAMDRIPTEVLAGAISAFAEVDRLAVWGTSIGVGLVLASLAQPSAPRVDAVIATAPTDVVWQALGAGGSPPKHSSLSRAGEELPWLPMHGELVLPQLVKNVLLRALPGRPRSTALTLQQVYARSRRDPTAVERTAIPVEQIKAPLLLIAGAADMMWPGAEMATRIHDRRRDAGVGDRDELLILPDTGHFIGPPATPTTVDRNTDLVSGGSPAGVASGQRLAWTMALAFLDRTLNGMDRA